MKNWYALYVRSRAEKFVSEILTEKNLENYLPLQKCLHQWSDRKKWVELPVVSGYVFVNIRPDERLEVLKTDFVLGFVRQQGADAPIPESQMNIMKSMLGQPDIKVEIDFCNHQIGQPVTITAGPFTGMRGNLVLIKNQSKVLIRMEQISMNILVEIPGSHIEISRNKRYLGN